MEIERKNLLLFLVTIFLFLSVSTNAQIWNDKLDVYTFSIPDEKGAIDCLKTGKDLETPKPTLIFCQGSLPIPLILKFSGGVQVVPSLANFDYRTLSQTYNIVVISKPFTPVIVKEEDLNKQYLYITDRNNQQSLSQDYLQHNYMDYYLERGNKVIDFLLQQKWVDPNKIYIIGHSEGSKVATRLASSNANIKALGYLSGNPIGRIDQEIRMSRRMEEKKLISKEEAQEIINDVYARWDSICANKDDVQSSGGDSAKTVYSFSMPTLEYLVNLRIPVYIAYGTLDIAATYCDLLPLDFIRAGKKNYTLKPYAGLEHNFFEVNEDGRPNYDKCYWEQVMQDFAQWLQTIEKS